MITDTVTTTRADVLSMVSCRYHYGHANQITDHFFWALLGEKLSDDEIEEFARDLESGEGYGEEDYEEARDNLTEWRNSQST